LDAKGEGIEIVQDDVVFLRDDGSAYGPEIGFYLKTEGVDPRILPLIYNAVAQPEAIFENVLVDYQGEVAFGDRTLTGNGRGIMQRADFGKDRSESLNIPPLSELDGMIILYVTRRNTVVPPVSKLNAEQAAAAFMLGESIESSGSDPARAGESVRVVGMNPFLVGDPAQEGNMMYEFARRHKDKLQFYLFNTGGVGEIAERKEGRRVVLQHPEDIGIPESAAIIRAIARDEIEWDKWDYFNVSVPKNVPGMDISQFNLDRFYSKELAEAYVRELNEERAQWLSRFKGLNPAVIQAFGNGSS
jgi:phosphoenolpyruvate carboxykinase (ATP)